MKSAIGHRGRHAGVSTTPFLAADVGGTPARVALMFRRPGTVQHGLSIAFVWLAATGMAIGACGPGGRAKRTQRKSFHVEGERRS
jgi:hypothetical protein